MIFTFDVEIINEMDGSFMASTVDLEVFDDELGDRTPEEFAAELESGKDSMLYDTILSNISIVPTFSHAE